MTDYFKFMQEVVENLPHCAKLGLKLPVLEKGFGTVALTPRPEMVSNPHKQVLHSAIVTTVLDTLCGTVASSAYEQGRTVATLDLRVDHLTPASLDFDLIGKAECFHMNDDIAYVRGWAWQNGEDNLIAKVTGTFMASGHFKLKEEDA